ncbi:hypothetical protein [Sporosarcina sp. P33]|uniref:hypothetical protein n=1 Tax=Sporosarcina sp. P33 TaxID=1930764 RepID=UPI0009C08CE5|nr:hypothetical protein [Sporosarcina sp. P33]ARD47592.1 hypothetical protein SporoP33_04630 [Sporosarcina sp. P33]
MTTKQEENKRMMEEVYKKREVLKNAPITIDEYQDLKAQGVSDVKIMRKYQMHNAGFNEWKRAAGLIKSAGESKKEAAQQAGEKTTSKEAKSAGENIIEIKLLKEQINRLKESHARDYEELQEKYTRIKSEMKRLEVSHNEEATDREYAEKQLDSSEKENMVLRGQIENAKNEIDRLNAIQNTKLADKQQESFCEADLAYKEMQHRCQVLENKVKILEDAEKLSLALAKRYVSLSERAEGFAYD